MDNFLPVNIYKRKDYWVPRNFDDVAKLKRDALVEIAIFIVRQIIIVSRIVKANNQYQNTTPYPLFQPNKQS